MSDCATSWPVERCEYHPLFKPGEKVPDNSSNKSSIFARRHSREKSSKRLPHCKSCSNRIDKETLAGKSLESIHELLDEVARGGDELGREEPLCKASAAAPDLEEQEGEETLAAKAAEAEAKAKAAAEEQAAEAKKAEEKAASKAAEAEAKAKAAAEEQAAEAKKAEEKAASKAAEAEAKAKAAAEEQAAEAKKAEEALDPELDAFGAPRAGPANGAASAASGEEDAEENEALQYYSPSLMKGFVERMKEHADDSGHQAAEARRRASLEVGDAKQVLLDYAANNQACAEMFRRTQLREERNLETIGAAAVSLLPSAAEDALLDDKAQAEGEACATLEVANAKILKLEKRLTQYRATIRIQNQIIRSYLESTTTPPAATPSSEPDQPPPPPPPPAPAAPPAESAKKASKKAAKEAAAAAAAAATVAVPAVPSAQLPSPARRKSKDFLDGLQAASAACVGGGVAEGVSGSAAASIILTSPQKKRMEENRQAANVKRPKGANASAATSAAISIQEAAAAAVAAATAASATVAVPAPKFAAAKAPARKPAVPAPASTTKGTSSGRKRSAAAATDAVTPAARASSSTAPASLPSGAGPSSADLLMDQPHSTLGHEDCGGCSWPVKWDRALNECPDDPRHKCLNCGHLVHSSSYVCADAGAKYTSLIVDEGSFYCSVTCQLLGAQ
jgi:hypothetical protein